MSLHLPCVPAPILYSCTYLVWYDAEEEIHVAGRQLSVPGVLLHGTHKAGTRFNLAGLCVQGCAHTHTVNAYNSAHRLDRHKLVSTLPWSTQSWHHSFNLAGLCVQGCVHSADVSRTTDQLTDQVCTFLRVLLRGTHKSGTSFGLAGQQRRHTHTANAYSSAHRPDSTRS